jgi:hypothetical protein
MDFWEDGAPVKKEFSKFLPCFEKIVNIRSIANVYGHTPKARKRYDKFGRITIDRSVRAREIFAHVVVDADNVKPLTMGQPHRLTTDEA